MMRKICTASLLTCILFFQSCNDDTKFYMPGEFEPQEAVWLGWQAYELYYPVNVNMVKSLLAYIKSKDCNRK